MTPPPASPTALSRLGRSLALCAALLLPLPALAQMSTAPPACDAGEGGATDCASAGPASPGNTSGTDLGAGNPINVITGNKYQRDTDLPALPGPLGLEIVRHYNSRFHGLGQAGYGWRLSYETDLHVIGPTVQLLTADGRRLIFQRDPRDPHLCASANPADGRIVIDRGTDGRERYRWIWPGGRELRFNPDGRLVSIAAPDGHLLILTRGPRGELLKVRDPQGRTLVLHYGPLRGQGFRGIVAIDSPAGRFDYTHAPDGPGISNLLKVTAPDGAIRHYHYEDPAHPHALTGISQAQPAGDGLLRLATWAYDPQGRAVLSVRGEPRRLDEAGRPVPGTGLEQVELAFVEPSLPDGKPGQTQLTNSLGQPTRYRHAQIGGQYRLLEARGPGCAGCGETDVRYGYDRHGGLTEKTRLDRTGQPLWSLRWTRDERGRVTRLTRQDGSGGKPGAQRLLERRDYPGEHDAPGLIARPSVVPGKEHQLRIDYNTHGQPVKITETGYSPLDEHGEVAATAEQATPLERTTTYTYRNILGHSLLAEIDGPLPNGPDARPKDSDITRYEWDERGNLLVAITHPTGLAERFEYDKDERLVHHHGIDGRSTRIGYDAQGEIAHIDRDGAITHFQRDANRRLALVQDPLGQRLALTYGAGGQLHMLKDAGNRQIILNRDTEGRLIRARLLSPDGSLAQQERDYPEQLPEQGDETGRDAVLAGVRRLIESAQEASNPARPDTTATPYAALQAFLSRSGEPRATRQARDAQGRLTVYHYNDFGTLEWVRSPVTGDTRYLHDAAGRVIARIQHDGSRAGYQRDAAGRVIALQSRDAQGRLDEDAHIAWGAANKPEHIRYMAGEEHFRYDSAARLSEHAQIIDGQRQHIKHQYDAAGRVTSRTLPSGQVLDYRYRGSQHPQAGLLESIWLEGARGLLNRPVVQDLNSAPARYDQTGFQFGNGLHHQLLRDANGRIIQAGNAQVGQTRLDYPPFATHAGHAAPAWPEVRSLQRVLLQRQAQAEAKQAFISRLRASATGWWGSPSDTWRKPLGIPGMWQDPANTRFDALGRQTALGPARFVYDSLNRLVEIKRYAAAGEQTVARYRYNLFGQRIAKTVTQSDGRSTRTTHYFYDGGQLIAESDAAGAIEAQYIWLNAQPVGLLKQGHLFAIHTDHRNAPLAVSDEARQVVWQASVADYLRATPVQGEALGQIEFNLRGSNQYYDAESGLHYNTHRYYDPIAAHYLTPDPLGLAAGPDLYAFALDQPHRFSDPLGLAPESNQDVSGWSMDKRLEYSFKHAAEQFPGELGDALLELASPQALATTAAIFGVWAAAQFTPYGWAADLALVGIGYLFLGAAVWDVIEGVYNTSEQLLSARCEADLRKAGDTLASALATASANAGVGGVAAGAGKIAKLLKRIFKDGASDTLKAKAAAAISESWFGTFKPGRARSGKVENDAFVARRSTPNNPAYPPWKADALVTDIWLNPGDKIYMINGKDRAPGGWASSKQYTSLEEARRELSLLETFTDGKGQLVVQEYTVKSPIPVRNGTVGPIQSRTNPAEAYPGGGQQYELLLNRSIKSDDYIILTNETLIK